MINNEIERKFLVTDNSFKDYAVKVMDIRQGYVGVNSALSKGECRISIRNEKAYIGLKSINTLSRLEYDITIDKDEAEILLKNLCRNVISKTRYIIPEGDLKWEVDVFHDDNNGLIVAEIELPDENYLDNIYLPDWIGEEVTNNPSYYNYSLAEYSFKELEKDRKFLES